MSQPEIDMAAVARVSRRVQLADIKLVKLEVEQFLQRLKGGPLTPLIVQECAGSCEENMVRVVCAFTFNATSNNAQVATAKIVYHLFYKLNDEGAVAPQDLNNFAVANGAYNSWPFVRELLFSITGRMGLPPFILPVLIFQPPKPNIVAKPALAAPKSK